MIILLLLLIVAILLFGAGAVKGWLKGGVMLAIGAFIILGLLGAVANKWRAYREDRQRQELAALATADTR